ncbi:MAG: NADH-quinone oxidoreductase subunit NuoE [Deltaproteobacteria bacterium]|nr:NADH-quinone oxidoreductase subunit NuoE [Deltaproteobacteria bacterium]MBI2974946.1 NADH-quinone oxidoreductase subunit NuoE [Deltaproteobacteria bacterium]
MTDDMNFTLSKEGEEKIGTLLKRYPSTRAALLPALWLVQDEAGWISDEAAEYVAAKLDLPAAEVYGTLTFYTMFNRRKLGRHHIEVCTNICCWLKGSEEILTYLKAKLGINEGETTEDGKFTLSTVECLGACGEAPMMMVDLEYYGDLTHDKIDEILKSLN